MPKKGKASDKSPRSADPGKRRKGLKKGRALMTLDKVKTRRAKSKKRPSKKKVKKYKVPSDQEVVDAINTVMARDHIIRSQTEFQSQVHEELKAKDPDFTITGERLRKIALDKAGLTIEIQGREVESDRAISRCPVCRSPLKAMKNITIYGGTVTLGFKCTKCPFWTGKKRRVPTRYTFYKMKR
jgi:hypothetical protein